jgi:hypothetical protein
MALTKEYLTNNQIKNIAGHFIAFFSFLAVLLYSLGYFMIGGGFTNHGFGKFKMNLNALFDPKSEVTLSASRIFPELDTPSINAGFGDYEGFNFLGSGIIFMLLIITPIIIYHFENLKLKIKEPQNITILIFFFLITLYSISNNIYIGNIELFSYDLPNFTKIITKTFRSSGRFFWINYYLIYFFIFVILFRYCKNYKHLIVGIFLIIQIFDMIPTFKQVNNVFYKNKSDYAKIYKENIKLQNPAWDLFAKKYKKIIYVVPTRFPKEYFPLAYFAAKNKLKTNFGYFSRVNKRTVAKKNSELLSKINRNDFDKDSLYIFFNDESWEISRKKNPAITKTIDGYRVLAP